MLASLDADATEVRTPEQLAGLDGLVIPGGESTTIMKGMARDGLDEAIRAYAQSGRPILGSCAGMIVCDRDHLGIGDYRCLRNAFGRQLQSFEQDLRIEGLGRGAAARGLHPRALGRGSRERGGGARRGGRPPGRGPRREPAGGRLPRRADRRQPRPRVLAIMAHAVTSACAEAPTTR